MLKMDFLGLTTLTVIHDALVTIEPRAAASARSGHAPARRRARLPHAPRGAHRRRLPVRVAARHGPTARHALRPLRRPRRVATRSCAPARSTPACTGVHRGASAARSRSRYALPELQRDPRADLRRHHLPGTGDAHRAACWRASRSPKPTCCAKRSARRTRSSSSRSSDKFVEKAVARGPRPPDHRGDRRPDRDVRPLRLQQVALGRVLGLSYQTAWLKTHHPAEFMAALLSS